jgi:predicted transcriptional regulator
MNTIKLTVRLPVGTHSRLSRRAQEEHRSLNQIIVQAVEVLLQKIEVEQQQLSEYDLTMQVIRASGLWEPMGPEWNKYIDGVPDMTAEEIREALRGIPPVSEIVIAERGER